MIKERQIIFGGHSRARVTGEVFTLERRGIRPSVKTYKIVALGGRKGMRERVVVCVCVWLEGRDEYVC